jgi:hypothetical protein
MRRKETKEEEEMKVDKKTLPQIQETIDEVQKRAKTRLIKADDIYDAILKAENKLYELNIPQKYWTGCQIHIEPEAVPIKYDYQAEGTAAIIERKDKGWELVRVYRDKCKRRRYGHYREVKLILSDVAHQNIPDKYPVG